MLCNVGPPSMTSCWKFLLNLRLGALPFLTWPRFYRFASTTQIPQSRSNYRSKWRTRTVARAIAAVIGAVLLKQPNTAFAQFSWIGGGMSSLRNRAHLWSVLLSGKPGAVQIVGPHLPKDIVLREIWITIPCGLVHFDGAKTLSPNTTLFENSVWADDDLFLQGMVRCNSAGGSTHLSLIPSFFKVLHQLKPPNQPFAVR